RQLQERLPPEIQRDARKVIRVLPSIVGAISKRPMDTIRARSPVRALVCANEQKAAAAQSQTDSHKLLRCARIPRPFVTDNQRRERRRFDDSRVTGYITIDGYKIDLPGVTCQ